MAIERRSLRVQVRDELMARMRSGQVAPGQGINEVSLAADLGVSRTPLREALISLESEGQIVSQDGRGFSFPRLSASEFTELAPIMAVLEGLALELTPESDLPGIGAQLQTMAENFAANLAEHGLIMRRDDEWHKLMISQCPNSRLLDVIAGVRNLFHRYESLLVPDEAMIERNAAEHGDIARCLIRGDVAGAKAALRVNWTEGARRVRASASLAYLSE